MQRDLGRALAGGGLRAPGALDVPGTAADSLEIEPEGDMLTVRRERQAALRRERRRSLTPTVC
jgi:hypothetical protein